jgi:riboflavin kinase/FMN adenylyltransferase
MTGNVVTVGTFDGVHLGHRRVVDEIVRRARARRTESVLVTFEPHPLEIVNPGAAPLLLTLPDERREILARTEVDVLAVLEFTRDLSQASPEEFVQLLLDRYGMQELVIGYDHGFGRGRAGDVALLRELGERRHFEVDVLDVVMVDGRAVSSTAVRRAVAGGDLDLAQKLLGRRYSLAATVVHGAGRGRDIGYRTINLAPPEPRKLLPPEGVYAVAVEWDGGQAGGMMHQGPRPTFGESARSLEIHLLDAEVDLYGQGVKVSWVKRLRDVKKFPSPEALKQQLDNDFSAARAALTQ